VQLLQLYIVLVHFEDQNFQYEEEVVACEEGSIAGEGADFGEKAPGTSLVTAAFTDFLMDLRIDLHFALNSLEAC
jgi:hypothetical protein